MTNKEFKYWVCGYMMLSNESELDKAQIKIISNHVELVKTINKKLDPDIELFLERINSKIAMGSGYTVRREQFEQIFSETIGFIL